MSRSDPLGNIFYLVIISLVMLIGWPGGAFLGFKPPQVFSALGYTQIIILTYIGGRLAVKASPRSGISLEDWLKYTPLSPAEVAVREIGRVFLGVLFMFFSSLPLVILSYFMGGVFLKSALVLYLLLPLPILAFINFGFFLRLIASGFSIQALNVLGLAFAVSLFLTRTPSEELFYLNPRFFLFILILSLPAFFIFLRRLKKIKEDLTCED
jgi:hypothetical protein